MIGRLNMTRATLNEAVMWVLLLVILFVPFILGGNRPLVWIGVALILSATCLIYFAFIAGLNVSTALPIGRFPVIAGIIAIFSVYLLLQVLPIANFLPPSLLFLPRNLEPVSTISVARGDTFMAMVRWYSVITLFYLVLQCTSNRTRSNRFLAALFWVVVIHAVYGFFLFFEMGDTILFVEKWAYKGSMTGGFVNRNTFGTFLATGSVIGLSIISVSILKDSLKHKPRSVFHPENITMFIGWMIIFTALARTNSRMGLFVGILGVALIAFHFLLNAKGDRFSRVFKLSLGTIGLLVVFALVIGFYGLSTVERLGSTDSDYDVRSQLYQQVWQMVLHRPWTGYGGGTFETSYPMFHELPVSVDLVWDKAHNTYLALFADYGLIFGFLPILAVALMFFKILRKLWISERPDANVLAALSLIVVAATHAVFDFSLEIQGYTILFVAVVANGFSSACSDQKDTAGAQT